MSEVAGRLSVQAGAHFLERENGGKGVLLGGVPGVGPARVLVIGGGMVGTHAADTAIGMGAEVMVVDRSAEALKALWRQFGSRIRTVFSTRTAIEEEIARSDLVVGGVLVPGAAAPKLVTEEMIRSMEAGSVVVDVAIDQGGCFETSHPTTHAEPTYRVHDVVHYCVANMPGAVPRTSTQALNNATLPFVLALADKGYRKAMEDDPHLRDGLNVRGGHVTQRAVARELGYAFRDPLQAIYD
jgi:alanine dehydrogenase